MQPRTQLILTATATFLAGLLTGATVFSDVLRQAPPPAPAEQAAPSVPAEPAAAEEPPARIAAVTALGSEPSPEPPAAVPEPPPPAAEPPAVSPEVTAALKARVDELTDGWGRMQAELAELRQRIAVVERREAEAADDAATPAQTNRATTAAQRQALLSAGVAPEVADDILLRSSELSLARLDLYDQAAREGWLDSQRYRDELQALNEQRVSIEDEIGPDAYDRYLYQTGQPNRVAVDSVLPGSAGEASGLLPGDVIERYGDVEVLDFADLRAATSAGERGEPVSMTVVRDGERIEVVLPRGPIGIGLDATRVDPNP